MRTQIVIKIETICPGHTPILSTKFHPSSSTTFWYVVLNCLAQSFNDEESLKNIIMSGSGHGSSPKLNHFFHVTHQTWPPCFIRIRRHLFEISCTQTNRETDRKGWKHNLLHLELKKYVVEFNDQIWNSSSNLLWIRWKFTILEILPELMTFGLGWHFDLKQKSSSFWETAPSGEVSWRSV